MTLPFVPETSTERCPRCCKRLAETLGQDATTGWVHTHLWCMSCDYTQRTRAWPHKTQTVLTVAEIIRRRNAHLDRDGKSLTASEIAKMSPAEFEEWLHGAHA